ncbi:CorA family divalent cation transporter [Lactobacillus helveticus]|uniref:CorA family divalent cation transporter n=1 Tax=Lactobacillus helveticus TaxID=1587 RepID=UPI001D11221B
MTKQSQLTKMIQVYADLLDSISSLFTAMMDSHLNHLMKYLDSAALIIAISALISGIWGMNIGGLPGKNDEKGFWILLILGALITLIWSFLLKKKKYND